MLTQTVLDLAPEARLDITGSFHASTADSLQFEDASKFYAQLSKESQLTASNPVAFGFLSGNPKGVTVSKSFLEAGNNNEFSIVGGDILIKGATLRAKNGKISMISTASPGDVSPESLSPDLSQDSFDTTEGGKINLTEGASIEGGGKEGG